MPCRALLIPFTLASPDPSRHWQAGNIIVVQHMYQKWSGKERLFFQPAILPEFTFEEALEFQGRNRADITLDDLHNLDWQRAAMRNKTIESPEVTLLKIYIRNGPEHGKPF